MVAVRGTQHDKPPAEIVGYQLLFLPYNRLLLKPISHESTYNKATTFSQQAYQKKLLQKLYLICLIP